MPKIMVCDDEEDILESVKMILEKEGYEVITVDSGKGCLKALEKQKVDLLILDFFMPGMSGREVLEKIRENPETRDLKVAFMTVAKFSETGKDVIEKLKIVDYIQKPIDLQNFKKRIKEALKKK